MPAGRPRKDDIEEIIRKGLSDPKVAEDLRVKEKEARKERLIPKNEGSDPDLTDVINGFLGAVDSFEKAIDNINTGSFIRIGMVEKDLNELKGHVQGIRKDYADLVLSDIQRVAQDISKLRRDLNNTSLEVSKNDILEDRNIYGADHALNLTLEILDAHKTLFSSIGIQLGAVIDSMDRLTSKIKVEIEKRMT